MYFHIQVTEASKPLCTDTVETKLATTTQVNFFSLHHTEHYQEKKKDEEEFIFLLLTLKRTQERYLLAQNTT